MPYTAEISRSNPTAFLLMIDQSSSMADPFGKGLGSKAEEAAKVVNRLLTDFTIMCAKGDDQIYDYFEIGVLGYGGTVGNAFTGALGGSLFQQISKIGDNPLRLDTVAKKVPDGAGGIIEENVSFPIWLEARTSGHTPMCQAFTVARDAVQSWVSQHPSAFPPTVLNITDGESTDGDPTEIASGVASIATDDGPVLVFNCNITADAHDSILYPEQADSLRNPTSKMLFETSSVLPSKHLELARTHGLQVTQGSRGFVYNADLVDLTIFLEIGTRVTALSAELR